MYFNIVKNVDRSIQLLHIKGNSEDRYWWKQQYLKIKYWYFNNTHLFLLCIS